MVLTEPVMPFEFPVLKKNEDVKTVINPNPCAYNSTLYTISAALFELFSLCFFFLKERFLNTGDCQEYWLNLVLIQVLKMYM